MKNEKELENIWNFEKFKQLAKELYRIMKKGGVVVWVVGDATINGSETGNSFRQALYFKDECGFNLHDTMIYLKRGFAFPSQVRYHQVFEYMFIFSKGKPKTFSPIKDRKNKYKKQGGDCKRQKDGSMKKGNRGGLLLEDYGQRYNVWDYKMGGGNMTKDKIAYKHPAIFPEQLAHDHIISWSNKGDIVLDPLSGSGTTLKMAEKLNCRWIGIEISEEYCEIAKKRIEEIICQKELFEI
jgi:site-specific DNA-methyltransferase (adenine-specific)